MQHHESGRRGRIAVAAGALVVGVISAVGAGCQDDEGSTGSATPGVVEISTVTVGDPGNPSVGIIPFQGPPKQGIYESCESAPDGCVLVGEVDDEYRIGELEITVAQYVTFLNTVDPEGTNERHLYSESMDPEVWPEYGAITASDDGVSGAHYAVADPEWASKPIGFMSFYRGARFVNSLFNGEILSRTETSTDGFDVLTYRVRLSPDTEQGMYDLRVESDANGPTRSSSVGFVLPSQNEWIKAAYFDPKGGGTYSYWQYPTSPFERPNAASLDPDSGDVVNAENQPLATYSPRGANSPSGSYPEWCPPEAGQTACDSVNPRGLSAARYRASYRGNVSTVGQALTRSPWGTLDQGGNVVEWTDTITPSPKGSQDGRVWRRLHGGVANTRAYQLWISAIGLQPQDNPFFERNYPWAGFRVAVIGDP